jgi:hypothetical protein
LLEKNPSKALGVYSGKTGGFDADKMRFALGDQNANRLLGSVNAEYLNTMLQPLAGGSQGLGVFKGGLGGYGTALAAEAAYTGQNILQGLTLTMSPFAITGMLLGGIGKAAYTVRERKIADQVLRLAAD